MTSTGPIPPLTTIFTPPTQCATQWTYTDGTSSVTQTSIWQDAELFLDQTMTCLPPGYLSRYGVYSPGICPGGYTTNHASTVGGTTTGYCCPSGYLHNNDCRSTYSSSTTAVMGDRDNPTTTTVGPGVALKRAITIYNAASDNSRLAAVTGSGSNTASATTGAASSVNNVDATPGLSTGAKAGIGVGVGGGTMLVVIIGLFFFVLPRRREKKKKAAAAGVEDASAGTGGKPQLDGTEIKQAVSASTPIQELSSRDKRYEVDGKAYRTELPAVNHEVAELPAEVTPLEKSVEKS